MTHTSISNKYKEDFLAQVCESIEQDLTRSEQKQKGIGYFLQRLDTLEEKAQANGLSEELLFEILSYDPDSDKPDSDKPDSDKEDIE